MNTRTISGGGTLHLYEYQDSSSYDNGIEYGRYESDSFGTYRGSRFVRDPEQTVDMIFLIPELVNSGSGRCTLAVNGSVQGYQ